MDLNKIAKVIHKNAVEHGWWEEERNFGEIIALCHTELSEAYEEYRNNKPVIYKSCMAQNKEFGRGTFCKNDGDCETCTYGKPEGIAVELADCIIRILDFCGKENIDIEQAIQIKHEYNKTRPYRHGNKKA